MSSTDRAWTICITVIAITFMIVLCTLIIANNMPKVGRYVDKDMGIECYVLRDDTPESSDLIMKCYKIEE